MNKKQDEKAKAQEDLMDALEKIKLDETEKKRDVVIAIGYVIIFAAIFTTITYFTFN